MSTIIRRSWAPFETRRGRKSTISSYRENNNNNSYRSRTRRYCIARVIFAYVSCEIFQLSFNRIASRNLFAISWPKLNSYLNTRRHSETAFSGLRRVKSWRHRKRHLEAMDGITILTVCVCKYYLEHSVYVCVCIHLHRIRRREFDPKKSSEYAAGGHSVCK